MAQVIFSTPEQQQSARARLDGIMAKGLQDTESALQDMQHEFESRRDIIVRPAAMDFDINQEKGIRPVINSDPYELTHHSRGQLLSRAGVPQTFADKLLELGEYDLLRDNLRRLLVRTSNDGILVRHVGPLAKGILSSSYRRMDASPIFEGFFQAGMDQGFKPFRGVNTETRYALTMIRPEITEVTPGELVLYTVQLMTSDYGAGALAFNMGVIRFICVNLMTGTDVMRKVHLGRRFDSDEWNGAHVVELSQRTHQLDNRTVRSAIQDAVRSSGTYIKAIEGKIQENHAQEVNLEGALQQLKKQGIPKETIEKVKATYEAELPVEALPQQPGAWRFSNVLSLLAKSAQGDAKLELEKAAYNAVAA